MKGNAPQPCWCEYVTANDWDGDIWWDGAGEEQKQMINRLDNELVNP